MHMPPDHHGRATTFYRMGLGERAAELAWYLHVKFPMEADGECEWVDVNPTLGRVCHSGRPWRRISPTMTGASQMMIRFVVNGRIVLRPQTGTESFALMGWHASYFRPTCVKTEGLLKNLAGNAYSAFAISPMLMLAFAGHGVISGLRESWVSSKTQETLAEAEDDAAELDMMLLDDESSD